MDQQQCLPNVVRVSVKRDNGGYGMKVSGDNPVYVQSVKEGNANDFERNIFIKCLIKLILYFFNNCGDIYICI